MPLYFLSLLESLFSTNKPSCFPINSIAFSFDCAVISTSAEATFLSSLSTKSADNSVFSICLLKAFCNFACTSTFFNIRCPCEYAVFCEYPALIAACVAFLSTRYSSQNRFCLSVSFTSFTCLLGYNSKRSDYCRSASGGI